MPNDASLNKRIAAWVAQFRDQADPAPLSRESLQYGLLVLGLFAVVGGAYFVAWLLIE